LGVRSVYFYSQTQPVAICILTWVAYLKIFLKDGRKSLENGLRLMPLLLQMFEETNGGGAKLQPVIMPLIITRTVNYRMLFGWAE